MPQIYLVSAKSKSESQSNSGLMQSTSNRINMEPKFIKRNIQNTDKTNESFKKKKGSSSKKLEFKGGSPNKSLKDVSSIIPELKDVLYVYEEISDSHGYIDTYIKQESRRRTLFNTNLTDDVIQKSLKLMTNRYVSVFHNFK